MEEQFLRTAMLLGENGVRRLQNARVAVFGLGGVGGYVVEALARSGVGALDLIDDDKVCQSFQCEPADSCHPCHGWNAENPGGGSADCGNQSPLCGAGIPGVLPAGDGG